MKKPLFLCILVFILVFQSGCNADRTPSSNTSETTPESTDTSARIDLPQGIPEEAAVLAKRASGLPLLIWKGETYAPVIWEDGEPLLADPVEADRYIRDSDGTIDPSGTSEFELYALKGWEDNVNFVAVKTGDTLCAYTNRGIAHTIPIYGELEGTMGQDPISYDETKDIYSFTLDGVSGGDPMQVFLSEDALSLFEPCRPGDPIRFRYCGTDDGKFNGLDYVCDQELSCVYFLELLA